MGMMSGTSADGIDAAIFDFGVAPPQLKAQISLPYPEAIKQQILELSQPGDNEIDRLGTLDGQIGQLFANCANQLIAASAISKSSIRAIGSHGQTVRHRPLAEPRFSLQIGNPHLIAQETGITTIADFRRRDLAVGGQGAPLAPAFHQAVFYDDHERRCIVNIGGICNVSVLHKNPENVLGYDTGPGNVLLDGWIKQNLNRDYDNNGQWAASGAIHADLLRALMAHPYLQMPPPKSTGREDFHMDWLRATLIEFKSVTANDVQATLCEFTALSMVKAIQNHSIDAVYTCGGGAHNTHLIKRIAYHLPNHKVSTTAALGLAPDWVETGLCAWLASRTLGHQPGNIPSVTGASRKVVLGAIYPYYSESGE